MAWQRTRIAIPEDLGPDERIEVASEVIGFIKEKAQQESRGYNPETGRLRRFAPYSKEYAERKGQTKVDLTLDDKMLRAMRLLSHKRGSLLIGFENGTTENDKAEGNQLGTYGQSSPIPGKARPFLGITGADLKRILQKYGG